MQGAGGSSRGDVPERDDLVEAIVPPRAQPTTQPPAVLQEPAIRRLEQRRVELIGRG
jgi:hypothetical protein